MASARFLYSRVLDRAEKRGDCLLWMGAPNGHGYGQIKHMGRLYSVHRVAWEAANGRPVPGGLCVCHTCDVRNCVNPAHLWVGSKRDNARDKAAKGRCQNHQGENHPRSRLSVAAVQHIRARLQSGDRQHAIARDFGIDQSTVSNIKTRRLWAHIQ